jgi:F-type H+-transporting ATPase subunit epsilon
MSSMKVSVISPEKILFSGEAVSLKVPSQDGYIGILPNHASLLSQMGVGILELRTSDSKIHKFVVDGGFCEVKKNSVNILADGGALKEQLFIEELRESLKKLMAEPIGELRNKNIQKVKSRILLIQS